MLTDAEKESQKEKFVELVKELEEYRKAHNITRRQMAKRLGLRTNLTIYHWLIGNHIPYPRVAYKIMQILGKKMTVAEFKRWSRILGGNNK